MHSADGANPFRLPLTLRDWHFCYGLPITSKEYLVSAANGGFGSYQDWHEYKVVLDRVNEILEPFVYAGLHLVWGPRAWVFCSLLRQRHAVILLTHATKATATCDGALEFRGEMVPFRLIVSKVSPNFAGILDICACEADGIQKPLKRRAPGCATKVAKSKLTLNVWVAYYAEFLRLFFERPTTYYDAITQSRALI